MSTMSKPAKQEPGKWDHIDDHPLFRKKLLEKLNSPEQLDNLMTVASSRVWLALIGIAAAVIAVASWSFLATIESSVAGQGIILAEGDADATIYLSLQDSRRVRAGQAVKLSPLSFRQEEYGLLVGEITSISTSPETQEGMLAVLGNNAVVQTLIGDGLIVAANVSFEEADTPSGFAWTSLEGPPTTLIPSSLANVNVVVDENRPISLLWAYLD